MHRLLAFIVALLVAIGGVPSAASGQEATPAAETLTIARDRTDLRYFLPFTDEGLNPGLTVTGEERGTCDHESITSPGRPDAWNCIGEESNEIFDPCFESPFSTPDEPGALACVASPFATDVVLLTPTAPLPREKDVKADLPPMSGGNAPDAGEDESEPLPWALELEEGVQCTLATGATAVFAGMRINYFCSDGGMLLGEPDRSFPVWTVSHVARGAFASNLVDVTVAWL
jgi:hypothetical protein